MAELTPLDEKLGEVLGLAQAAQAATDTVAGMDGADAFRDDLTRMHQQAHETGRRTDELVDALDGFEFLSMAEAGELCHREIVGVMAEKSGEAPAKQPADWAVPVQREHIETVRRAALALAVEEASA